MADCNGLCLWAFRVLHTRLCDRQLANITCSRAYDHGGPADFAERLSEDDAAESCHWATPSPACCRWRGLYCGAKAE
jgi:hypothetical protein